MKSKRQTMREKRQRQQLIRRMIWAGAGAVLVALLGYAVWAATRPAVGEEIAIMAETDHVPEGSDPGPYNSDPPTSGRHYAESLPSGFYEESEAASLGPYPEGRLVHSLEHGYVILWYDCTGLASDECGELKGQMRDVMDGAGNLKVIAFPWSSIAESVVMTSWGQMLRLERFDPAAALQFIRTNRNRAPEPQAP